MNPDCGALRILLQFFRAQEAGDPYAFRFEPQDYILPTAGGDSPSARFDWTQEVLADLQAVRLPGRDPAVVQRLGERLRRFVRDAGWAQHEEQIAGALTAHRPIFLTIRSSAAELYALPWELLTLKSGQFIGEVDGLLLRFEWPESQSASEQPTPRPEGGRILLAWSAAAGAVPAAEHIAAIAAACAAGFQSFLSGTAATSDVLAHASLEHIVQRLEAAQQAGQAITVLHLLCHGTAAGHTFGIALDGADGPVVIDAAQLRQQLAPFANMVRLIVLSACDSGNLGTLGNQLGSLAQALHRCGFQAVIASRFPLSVAGSVTLTENFYGALLSSPASLETAFLAARKRLARKETDLPREQRSLDWASMQLYARHADGEDTRPIVFRPFRGLLAFQSEHRRFFFGRNKEVLEIMTDLQALSERKGERFLIVAGASGTGKSSLVFAGAVPKLLTANPQLVLLKMRPGNDPERVLNESLAKLPAGASGLLVVDQFEEVFTHTEVPAVRATFVRRLWSLAAAPEPGLRIIITLRVDFIGRCGELVVDMNGLRLDRVAYDEQYRVFIAQLEPDQLRAAIVEPTRMVGLELQAGLADRMLDEVGSEPGALPLLQDALDALWQRRSGRTLTQSAYDELGGVVGALQKRADVVLDRLSRDDQTAAQRLLVNLVAVSDDTALDTRLRVPLAELRQYVATADTSGFERVLKDLVDARLLVVDDDKRAPSVEVAHEALIRKWPKLRAWLDEDRAGLVVQRRVRQTSQQWALRNRDESLLYRGAQLVQASEWRKSWESRLGDLDRSFLNASDALRVAMAKQDEERLRRERTRAQQTRLAAIVLGLLFVVAVVAGGLAYRNSVLANQKSDEAHDALIIAIVQTRNEDPTAVATLLRESRHQDSTLWTQAAADALYTGTAETVLRGSASAVTAVAFSPDGKKIVTGSGDHIARIWNADGSGAPVLLKGHKSDVISVAFSVDEQKIVTGSKDRTARIWNADGSGTPVVLEIENRVRDDIAGMVMPAEVAAVAFSRDGKKIVTGCDDHTARIYADGSGAPVELHQHTGMVTSVAFSPDGKKVATGADVARIWNVNGSGEPVVLNEYEQSGKESVIGKSLVAVAFSPDGKKIVTSSGPVARIWNADGSGVPVVLRGHQSDITVVAFSPDGKRVVTGSWDNTARIWNADNSGFQIGLMAHAARVTAVAFSPDGKRVVTGSWDNTARIWNAVGSDFSVRLDGHEGVVISVAFSPDGKKIASGSVDNTARVWSVDGSGTPIVLSGDDATVVRAVAFSPDGKKLVTGSSDTVAYIWNADGSGSPVPLKGHAKSIRSVAFSPDGQKIVTGSWDKTVRIWNADGSGSSVVLKGYEEAVCEVAFSGDGKKILASSGDHTVRIWNADGSGSPVLLKGPDGVLAFSRDGKQIVSGFREKTVRIWNIDGSGAAIVFKGEAMVMSAAFSPDGKQIVTGSDDNLVRIWKVDGSGAPVVLRGHRNTVAAVAFSPDGKRIVSGSHDRTARIWTIANDALLAALWKATTDCLPSESRRELFLESPDGAMQGYKHCRQEIARRHGGSMP